MRAIRIHTIMLRPSCCLPVLMLREPIPYMEEVVGMGKELEEAEKTSFIVNLLSSVAMLTSFGGYNPASLGFGAIGRSLVYLGETRQRRAQYPRRRGRTRVHGSAHLWSRHERQGDPRHRKGVPGRETSALDEHQ
ncbi:hypothetical protein F4778DRAFT_708878 [Xylariomycetidae sp. FL2044]|nr:hypothetical protein F4778DRAFT_708878 [Xylariomycetidae sp. FL2044]